MWRERCSRILTVLPNPDSAAAADNLGARETGAHGLVVVDQVCGLNQEHRRERNCHDRDNETSEDGLRLQVPPCRVGTDNGERLVEP